MDHEKKANIYMFVVVVDQYFCIPRFVCILACVDVFMFNVKNLAVFKKYNQASSK